MWISLTKDVDLLMFSINSAGGWWFCIMLSRRTLSGLLLRLFLFIFSVVFRVLTFRHWKIAFSLDLTWKSSIYWLLSTRFKWIVWSNSHKILLFYDKFIIIHFLWCHDGDVNDYNVRRKIQILRTIALAQPRI